MESQKKRKRVDFCQTQLGFLLKHEVPIEYGLIVNSTKDFGGRVPKAELIEAVGYSSNDPFFRSIEYRKALIKFKKEGAYTEDVYITNADKELYYIDIRRNKMLKELREH